MFGLLPSSVAETLLATRLGFTAVITLLIVLDKTGAKVNSGLLFFRSMENYATMSQ